MWRSPSVDVESDEDKNTPSIGRSVSRSVDLLSVLVYSRGRVEYYKRHSIAGGGGRYDRNSGKGVGISFLEN